MIEYLKKAEPYFPFDLKTIYTSSVSSSVIYLKNVSELLEKLYEQIVNPHQLVRRMTVTFNRVMDETYRQYDLFTDPTGLEREHQLQKAMLDIKGKYGKNAILKGMNLEKSATTKERNLQIGGHKSGEI